MSVAGVRVVEFDTNAAGHLTLLTVNVPGVSRYALLIRSRYVTNHVTLYECVLVARFGSRFINMFRN